jgi:hypothetical protein
MTPRKYYRLYAANRSNAALNELNDLCMRAGHPIRAYPGAAGWIVVYCGERHGVWPRGNNWYTLVRDEDAEGEYFLGDFLPLDGQLITA